MIQILTDKYSRLILSSSYAGIELDLGCGKGGFLLSLARIRPDRLIIGADVMLGRLRKVQRKVLKQNLSNVQLLRVNARDLIGYILPDRSINRVHVLCPDPWPKSRHRSKRLLTSEFLGRIATKIVPDGVLHISTDDAAYFSFIADAIAPLSCYTRTEESNADIKNLKTDFEMDFENQGVTVHHMVFRVIAPETPKYSMSNSVHFHEAPMEAGAQQG
jgi:tRNA (guanine-N7-)-methyltransferase